MREETTMGKNSGGPRATERPFPWVCPTCLKQAVNPRIRPYTATVRHDGLSHSIEIPALELPSCDHCGAELFDNHVDDQISQALRLKLGLLTPAQIRRARIAMRLNQRELAKRLRIASATISRWETGALIQSSAMDNYLRTYFAFPNVREALIGTGQDPNLGVCPDDRDLEPSVAH
jgi:putative zinc finger/helix-turn-helix YgiT family protein